MDKTLLRYIVGLLAIVTFLAGSASLFVIEPPDDDMVGYIGLAFLIMAFALNRFVPKRIIDEREIRVSAKANKWGIAALLAYAIIVALVAKEDPGFISVRLAVGGALFSTLLATMAAFQILKRMPNAEQDKWETR